MTNKCVLLSVRPQWCKLIASGKKTIEVRKTRPKLGTPFKCYIYCTVGGDALCPPHMNCSKWDIHRQNNGAAKGRKMTTAERGKSDYRFANGKVIGEFVCDKIYQYSTGNVDEQTISSEEIQKQSCLAYDELCNYESSAEPKDFCIYLIGLYGWHISALQIYDKPKELSKFTPMCRYREDDGCCQHRKVACGFQEADYNQDGSLNLVWCGRKVTRPPQSWCYVEELT